MPEEENIEVTPSVETPSEQPETVTPTVTETTEPVVPTEPELYELPDGRKVDADTLSKEWKENFYPDYTRKSQELAKVKTETLPNNEPAKNPLADPDYVPQTYEELAQQIEARMIEKQEARDREIVERRQEVENQVVNQLNTIKKTDPSLNENALFLHATKYGFRDLTVAYQNMKDMNQLAKTVQQTTAKNIAKRSDPVSISPGASGIQSDPSQFSTARDYLRSLNN